MQRLAHSMSAQGDVSGARLGSARHGAAWLGEARLGNATQGMQCIGWPIGDSRHSAASGRGTVRRGLVGRGVVRPG